MVEGITQANQKIVRTGAEQAAGGTPALSLFSKRSSKCPERGSGKPTNPPAIPIISEIPFKHDMRPVFTAIEGSDKRIAKLQTRNQESPALEMESEEAKLLELYFRDPDDLTLSGLIDRYVVEGGKDVLLVFNSLNRKMSAHWNRLLKVVDHGKSLAQVTLAKPNDPKNIPQITTPELEKAIGISEEDALLDHRETRRRRATYDSRLLDDFIIPVWLIESGKLSADDIAFLRRFTGSGQSRDKRIPISETDYHYIMGEHGLNSRIREADSRIIIMQGGNKANAQKSAYLR